MVRLPEFLDLIPEEKQWNKVGTDGTESSVTETEEKKLELKLGLPEGRSSFNGNHKSGEFILSSAKLYPFYSNIQYNKSNNTSGAKRALYEKAEGGNWLNRNDEFKPHKFIFSEKTAEKVFQLTPCPSDSLPSSAFQKETQKLVHPQHSKSPYLKTAEFTYLDGKPCSNSVSVPADSFHPKSSHERASAAPAVGWPPVRSFRKNLAARRPLKPSNHGLKNETVLEEFVSKSDCHNEHMFVKVCMDGVPIGRKLNLKAYDSYEQLSAGIDELFHYLLAAQRDYLVSEDGKKMEEDAKNLSDSKHENGKYTLVYYDNEGDRMLVGDVPWSMFVSTVKRLRVLKSSPMVATEMK